MAKIRFKDSSYVGDLPLQYCEVDGELSLDSGDADVARSQFLNVADILRPDKTVIKERHVHNQSG